jgi:hypothetical protein
MMKRFALVGVMTVLASVAGVAVATAADVAPGIVTPYLRVQAALAADKLDGVQADAGAIAAEARKIGRAAAKVQTAARKLEAAADLKAARTAFGELSDELVAYATATGNTFGAGVRQAFCPMVKKPWLQQGDTIQNPYYGKEMPTCGDFKK